nr:hypothetical protein [Tanacetum cinerariifolium]
PQKTDGDATFEVKEPGFAVEKPVFGVHVYLSSSAQTNMHDDKNKREDKGKSLVELSTRYRNLSVDFEDFFDNSTNEVNDAALEDITYFDDEEDVGAEADFTSLETNITVTPIPTTRVHKDHHVTQIIGDLSSATQTRGMTTVVKDQVKQKPDGIFISQDKYVAEILRKFSLTDGKSASTPIDTEKPLLKDPDVKKVNDVTRLQALIDRKKVIIIKATVQEAPRLDDAESIDCLPNEDIFTELSRMGGHHGMSSILSWLQLSSAFQQVEKLIFPVAAGVGVDDVPAADVETSLPSPTPTTQPPPPSQELPSTSHVIPPLPPSLIAKPSSPTQQQQHLQPPHDANISLDLLHTLLETCTTLTSKVEALEEDKEDASKQGEIISNIDADEGVTLKDVAAIEKTAKIEKDADVQGRPKESQSQIYKIDLEHADNVLSMDDELEPAKLKEVVEVVTTAKLMTELVTATSATITAAPNKGKGIMVEEPKPLKKQVQIGQDEAYARELEAELNKNTNWDDVIKQVQRKEKEDNDVLRYQALKGKPQTEAQARKNMMIYIRNMAGFKMDYFKGMSYDDIRLILEKYFNSNVDFLEKTKEQLEEKESIALKRTSESLEEKATKKQKLDEKVEELKKHLQIVPNDDDDVYTEATPLAHKRRLGDDLASREKISIDKVHFRSDAEQYTTCRIRKIPRLPTQLYPSIWRFVGHWISRSRWTTHDARGSICICSSRFSGPPSPDCVPGLEEPEQAPPLPEFVPEPVYPEFMPPEDEILPAKEQPLPAIVSPTTDSPGYIADSDLEEDPIDYPSDEGDDDDDDGSFDDDDEDKD